MGCVYHNVSNSIFVQDFNKLQFVKDWWVMCINGPHHPYPCKGYQQDSHCGQATNQINPITTIAPIHLIHETWQYCHVWNLLLELEQVYYMLWCSFHYILHSIWHLAIQWPNLQKWMTLNTQIIKFQGCIGLIDGIFIEIWNLWNIVTHGLWFNGWKKCVPKIIWWLWTIVHYSFTWMLATQVHFMMSPSCSNYICTKINGIFLCILMSTMNIQ